MTKCPFEMEEVAEDEQKEDKKEEEKAENRDDKKEEEVEESKVEESKVEESSVIRVVLNYRKRIAMHVYHSLVQACLKNK